jgi:outer membrane protein
MKGNNQMNLNTHTALRNILITGVTSLFACSSLNADIVGFRVGGDIWMQEWDGTKVTDGTDSANLDDSLDSKNSNGSIYAAIEHPLPVLPNIRVRATELEIDETSQQSFTLGTAAITPTSKIEADFSHQDFTLYYELIDLVVSLDLGLVMRKFDGGVTFKNGGTVVNEVKLDDWIPMIYVATGIELPFTGWSINIEALSTDFDGTKNSDYKVGIGYEIALGFAVELGFRRFAIEHEDNDKTFDATVEGAYGSLLYRF